MERAIALLAVRRTPTGAAVDPFLRDRDRSGFRAPFARGEIALFRRTLRVVAAGTCQLAADVDHEHDQASRLIGPSHDRMLVILGERGEDWVNPGG